jgi:predicted DNA-binding transcriptional regulator AlpA
MENKGYIREGYKENQKSHNESESSKAQMFFENLIWGVDEVCSFSGYAKGTIYNFVSRGEIPYRTRGRRKRLVFVPSEIIAWLKGEQT